MSRENRVLLKLHEERVRVGQALIWIYHPAVALRFPANCCFYSAAGVLTNQALQRQMYGLAACFFSRDLQELGKELVILSGTKPTVMKG
jgi:hypothetical protein